ncbi:MAG TPA: CPBP family glutamic-type intramembrane protease [Gaiellaceae bacterium]|jgi:membrane protease YdiL (CAAX protease family)
MAALAHTLHPARTGVLAVPLAALAAGELLVADGRLLAAAIVDAALVLALVNAAARRPELAALSVVPLVRLLALVMPLGNVAPPYWNALVGVPAAAAIVGTSRSLGLTRRELGLRRSPLAAQLAVAATGVPLGLAAYVALRPADTPYAAAAAAAVVAAAVVEELLFRGLLQRTGGPLLATAAYGVCAIATGSAWFVLVAVVTGAWFSYAVARRPCLWGVIAAHGLAAAGLVLVWPAILG